MHQPTRVTIDGQRSGPDPADTVRALLTDPDRPRARPKSLYLHIPFCFHKCHYCDFYSFVDTAGRQEPFLEALSTEIGAIAAAEGGGGAKPKLDTLFVGGGTPTLLEIPLWERLGRRLHECFDIAPDAEWSVECNPETATPDLMRTLAGVGVNRLSVGAQTFHPVHLKTLERWHDPDNVERALDLARDAGIERVSLDLIFSIPGQTLEEWEADLARAIAIGSGHVSAYALTYEPNTAMTVRLRQGKFEATNEDLEARMFERTGEVLAASGFDRYEVSNFATRTDAGGPCRHNLAYWRQHEWLAAGPSASAHVHGHRWKNMPRLTDWMRRVQETGGWAPVVDLETPDPKRALAERIMTGLRLAEGLDESVILEDAARLGVHDALTHEADRAVRNGHLVRDDRWRLTPNGLLFADGVSARLMGAID